MKDREETVYEIKNVKDELEELTEAEEDMMKEEDQKKVEIWSIKREIKKEFKVHNRPPDTKFNTKS